MILYLSCVFIGMFVQLLCIASVVGAVASDLLVFTSPGGEVKPDRSLTVRGVYGGETGPDGNSNNLYEYSHVCEPGAEVEGLEIKSMSYDSVSGYILFSTYQDHDLLWNLHRSKVCTTVTTCSGGGHNSSELISSKYGTGHKVGPIAYHDEEIYFLMMKEDGTTIELRKLDVSKERERVSERESEMDRKRGRRRGGMDTIQYNKDNKINE